MPCYCMVARYDCVEPNSGRREAERERDCAMERARHRKQRIPFNVSGIVWRRLKQSVPFAQPFRPHQIHFGADVPEYCFVPYEHTIRHTCDNCRTPVSEACIVYADYGLSFNKYPIPRNHSTTSVCACVCRVSICIQENSTSVCSCTRFGYWIFPVVVQ